MENGHDWKIVEKLSGLTVSTAAPIASSTPTATTTADNQDSSLLQVMYAMEAAEATIKQQVEDNIRLRAQLEHEILELHRYKLHQSMAAQLPPSARESLDQAHQVAAPGVDNRIERIANHGSSQQSRGESETRETQLSGSEINEGMKVVRVSGTPTAADNASNVISRLSSPSTMTSLLPGRCSLSPGRSSTGGDYGNGLMPLTESNNPNSSMLKKDLVVRIYEHDQEIMQLRKHLADYSIKEAQIRNEKYVLEKRIAYMRLAFDQQQQDLVDAASKSLSYRQDIIEENIRLAYAVQDAQQERSTFVSSLLPILAEYSLQPPVPDAQSIVESVKVLFTYMKEKLLLTESKLKELQYQLTPWRSETNQQPSKVNVSAPQLSPPPPPQSVAGAALLNVSRNGLEIVAQNQQAYSYIGGSKALATSDAQTTAEWNPHQQSGFGGSVANNVEHNDLVMGNTYHPVPNRTFVAQYVPPTHAVTQVNRNNEVTNNRQVTFRDPVGNTQREMDDQDAEGNYNERDSSNWSAGTSPYASPLNESSSPYPRYLTPVIEEGSSSYSEAADDDPLPAIEGLQISGEAFPGHKLQASGYSTNGTTSCNFEWVRHLQDGSVNYIDGAKEPNYLVTADDVDAYLAIEVQPLDNRKRKGAPVKVFANENKKITCDPEMQSQIEKILHKGQASFKILQFTEYHDVWEPATLAIKRGAYSIKCSGGPSGSGAVVAEKFSSNTIVRIPYGSPTEFIILSSSENGVQPRAMDPFKDMAAYGYGSVAWKERMESWKQKQEKLQMMKHENGAKDWDYDDDNGPDVPLMDEARRPLSRKLPIPSRQINPYRMIIIIRLVALGFFFHYRVMHPVNDAYALWLISVICEIWFAVSWILDQLPKWFPIDRETYLDRLSLRYEKEGQPSQLCPVFCCSFSAVFCCRFGTVLGVVLLQFFTAGLVQFLVLLLFLVQF